MKTSTLLTATLRQPPNDAEIVSHQLLLRAGMIRKLAAGIYTWLPLGLRVLRKVEHIVRDEMNKAGAQEIIMPTIQPAELWQQSGRWQKYGAELLQINDRHQRDFCFGPTHEEVITQLAKHELNSYKQLPVNFYQIQTKFRDEIRPRFGILRAREFLMKDAYSFHIDMASLQQTYAQMYRVYTQIFTRLGLRFRVVMADSGNIGGQHSHEFHALADVGEDQLVFSEHSDYAASLEHAQAATLPSVRPQPTAAMMTVATPKQYSIAAVCKFLNIAAAQCVKTLIVKATAGGLIALVLRGDHSLNKTKAEKLPGVLAPLTFADNAAITAALGCDPGSIGPVNLTLPCLVDHSAAQLADFVCGANAADKHLTGVNWGRDLPLPESVDIRNVCAGDPAADGSGPLQFARGIEVGHIFQLGTRYSAAMGAYCKDNHGKEVPLTMGCYGIGISRIVAAAIEQNHDEHGIIWQAHIAPFELALIPINLYQTESLLTACLNLYATLLAAGIEVLLDDRKERAGIMFSDIDLIGIPHRFVLSAKHVAAGNIEYKSRLSSTTEVIALSTAVAFITAKLKVNDD